MSVTLSPFLAALVDEWDDSATVLGDDDGVTTEPVTAHNQGVPAVDEGPRPSPPAFVPVLGRVADTVPGEAPSPVLSIPTPSEHPVRERLEQFRYRCAVQAWHRGRMARSHRRQLERLGQLKRPDDERVHDASDMTWEAQQYIGPPPEHLRPYWHPADPRTPDAVRLRVPPELLAPYLDDPSFPRDWRTFA